MSRERRRGPAQASPGRARVDGTVQGVGFRPYVFRLATELGLGGFVLNDERGVLLEVEGPPGAIDEFLARLPPRRRRSPRSRRSPPRTRAPTGERGFRIVESERGGERGGAGRARRGDLRRLPGRALRPGRPPLPLSVHQLHQLRPPVHDRPRRPLRPPADDDGRRSRCAPRCRAEYEDPLDRRFHAQPNACPALRAPRCGSSTRRGGPTARGAIATRSRRRPSSAAAARRRRQGPRRLPPRLPSPPTSAAVAALRARKHREDKPFALMAPDLGAARELVELTRRRGGAADRAASARS